MILLTTFSSKYHITIDSVYWSRMNLSYQDKMILRKEMLDDIFFFLEKEINPPDSNDNGRIVQK